MIIFRDVMTFTVVAKLSYLICQRIGSWAPVLSTKYTDTYFVTPKKVGNGYAMEEWWMQYVLEKASWIWIRIRHRCVSNISAIVKQASNSYRCSMSTYGINYAVGILKVSIKEHIISRSTLKGKSRSKGPFEILSLWRKREPFHPP